MDLNELLDFKAWMMKNHAEMYEEYVQTSMVSLADWLGRFHPEILKEYDSKVRDAWRD